MGGWVSPRADLSDTPKSKALTLPDSNSGPSVAARSQSYAGVHTETELSYILLTFRYDELLRVPHGGSHVIDWRKKADDPCDLCYCAYGRPPRSQSLVWLLSPAVYKCHFFVSITNVTYNCTFSLYGHVSLLSSLQGVTVVTTGTPQGALSRVRLSARS
jgi:hypothetical protein